MRRIFILLGIMVISLILTACTGNQGEITPPSFSGVRIENTNPVSEGNLVTFYQGKQDEVLVEVSINNPSNVNIKSIVINGYTHNSTKFTADSTSQVIKFYLNVGNTLGETVYSVDRINYLDGEKSVSVTVSNSNEFLIYVYKDEPTVTRENYSLTKSSVSIDFRITDVDGVIATDTLKARLYAGETLVEEQDITSGMTTVTFDELLANRLYEVKLITSYDLDDGDGLQNNIVLYSGSYSTLANGLPSASITNVDVTSNMVMFDVAFTDEDDVVVDAGLSVAIYNGDDLVETISITGSTTGLHFEDLFNDNDYTIQVHADYNLNDGLGVREDNVLATHSFSTLPRQVPEPALLELDLLENSIEFDVFIDDPDGIIDVNSLVANLYVEGDYVDQAEIINYHVDFQVSNLFANKEFTIEIIADYDLNDGLGVQEDKIIFTQTYSTLENARPSISINEIDVAQGYVTIDLGVADGNNTLMGALEAVLYQEGTAVQTIQFNRDTTEIIFDYPTVAGLTYYIEFYADYNLRDGSGATYDELLRRIVSFTAEYKAPIAEIKNVVTTTSTIVFDVELLDADQTVQPGETLVYLYLEGALVASQVIDVGANTVSFTNLNSNNEYEIVILSDFDLDDGSGVLDDIELARTLIMTQAKVIPTAETPETDSTDTSILFDVDIIDPDGVIIGGSVVATLFHEGTEIDSQLLSVGENFGITFTNLLSDNNYKVVYTVDYDLNDTNGVIADYVVGETVIRTEPKFAPTADFLFTESDETSITFDVRVTDTYDVITGDLRAVLILNDVPTGDEVVLNEGINTDVTFTNVYADERYYIDIVADYDLNDGESVFDDEVLESEFISTNAFDIVTAEITATSSTSSTITIDVDVFDNDDVITGNLQAVLYKDGVATAFVQPLVVGTNTGVVFTGVDSATLYEVRVETDYDLKDIDSPVSGAELDAIQVTTLPLSAPSVLFDNETPNYGSFTLTVNVIDDDNTVTTNLKAVLYKDGAPDGQEEALSVGINENVSFSGLLANNEYEVKVFSDYDLNDETGEQVGVEIGSTTVTTLAKLVPGVSINSVTLTRSTITLDVEIDDVDNVLAANTLKAGLYINDVLQTEKLLLTDTIRFDVSGMLADFDFEIRITGNYDLDDGEGITVNGVLANLYYTTLSYNAPTASIDDIEINQDTVEVDVTVVDNDDVVTDTLTISLYDEAGALVETINLTTGTQTVTFTQHLDYNKFYSVVVHADYNLLDGNLEQEGVILSELVTVVHNKLVPQTTITNVTTTQNSISFDANVKDNDAVIIPLTIKAELYLDGTLDQSTTLATGVNNVTFNTLQSNTEYVVRIITNYNNGDGNGTYTEYTMTTTTTTTEAKAVPSAEVLIDTIGATAIIVDITIDDDDSVSTLLEAILYDDDNNMVETIGLNVGNNLNVTFDELLGSSTFTLVVEATYNLSDGVGSQVSTIATIEATTEDSIAPTGAITNVTATTSTLAVTYNFTDQDDVSTEQYLRLYDGGVQVDEQAINAGTNQTYTFTELDPNTAYVVTIESTYDLNDLDGEQADVELATSNTSTSSLIQIDVEIIGKKTNQVDVSVTDNESILTSSTITATLYQDGVTFMTYIVQTESPTMIQMVNLLSDYTYTLEFEASYDVGAGTVTEVVYTHTFTTEPLDQPTVTLDLYEDWTFSPVTVDLTVSEDLDNVASDTGWTAYLYVDGVLQETLDIDDTYGNPENTTTTIAFSYNQIGTEALTVVITADVDMNDQPATPAVETVLESGTGIDAQN